ncbi:hypothetical protein GGX14DRAFT_560830 [Mycena pura]|uniref:MYND-type domain-containing protein n=1 Tax=Mycena pura TaxID=153505 RepID=A0AAD6VSB5_9AGAR|nr:hypothetical protein GGX14DRAFT_560830 [Mycena pura]
MAPDRKETNSILSLDFCGGIVRATVCSLRLVYASLCRVPRPLPTNSGGDKDPAPSNGAYLTCLFDCPAGEQRFIHPSSIRIPNRDVRVDVNSYMRRHSSHSSLSECAAPVFCLTVIALTLSNLSRLPVSRRKLAHAAARGSLEDMGRLVDSFHIPQGNWPHAIVPVFYVNLNTADIPMLQLDWGSQDTASVLRRVRLTITAFHGLLLLVHNGFVERGAYVDLWLSIWEWIKFLDTFREHLSDPSRLHPQYWCYISLIRNLWERANEETRQLITQTSSLRIVFGRAWAGVLFLDKNDTGSLIDVSAILTFDKVGAASSNATDMEDYATGVCEGRPGADLASCVVSHLQQAFRSPNSAPTPVALAHLAGVFYLLRDAFDSDIGFRESLLAQGIVATLTTICRSLSLNTSTAVTGDLNAMLQCLIRCFTYTSRTPWIAESIGAGLLSLLFACGPVKSSGVQEELLRVLEWELPAFAVYYSVLSELRRAFGKVETLDPSSYFSKDIRTHWQRFAALVEGRLQVVEEYKTGALTALRYCDNLECGKVCDKRALKCCSRCLSRRYCSRTCQKVDYRKAQHKIDCPKLKQSHETEALNYNRKDLSFFRALVNHDYTLRQHEIAVDLLRGIHAKAGVVRTVPCTAFDYTQGECKVSTRRLWDADLRGWLREWSRGRVQFHAVEVVHGPEKHTLGLPLRSERKGLLCGLRDIAESMPPYVEGAPVDLEPYHEGVRHLIRLEGLQTH